MRLRPLSGLLLAVLLAGAAHAGTPPPPPNSDGPPVEVVVYFSKDDKNWPRVDAFLTKLNAQYPRLSFSRVSIDMASGYKALQADEQRLELKEHGEITLVIGPFGLIDKGDLHQIETIFPNLVARSIGPKTHKGRLQSNPAAFAKKVFDDEAVVELVKGAPEANLQLYVVRKEKEQLGWIVDAYHPISCPVCSDAQCLVALELDDLKVKEVEPVRGLEFYGNPMAKDDVHKLVKQFSGQKLSKDLVKVDEISGATKTSFAYESILNDIGAYMRTVSQPKK